MNKSIFKNPEGKNKIMHAYDYAIKNTPLQLKTGVLKTTFGDTHFLEAGSQHQEIIILLHGASSNATSWLSDIAEYSKQNKVIAIDVIGEAGKSAETRPSYQTTDFAEWLKEVFDRLNISKANIVGLSQGGWLALRFATSYPELVDQLILLAPAGIVPTKTTFIIKALLYSFFGKNGRVRINRLVLGSQPVDSKIISFMDLIQTNFNARIEKEYIFSDDELSRLTMPVLLIGGEQDVIRSTQKIARRLQHIVTDFTIITIPEMGHVLAGLAPRILPFLNKTKC
ncbi:alpha/beta fold hydrolase [Chryseobacterium camelliae]|uniref:alpha/beta fold hydrolase n=1 Tax=Chryseobacterium camelliae TaxID=1265445 RepID=UPI001AE9A315|nr:alpha/beta hydrolase [Chryseobacterium camelliae]MDR6513769.1 pimeloyl-ACP methyl ester carboxylesterase [Chryseobacterium camelliae]